MSETSRSAIISTHDLARRSTFLQNVCHLAHIFQLTTSRGGRPEAMSALALHLHFNSRPHEEVDIIHHNTIESMYKYFNSRPRKEVDEEQCKHNSERSEFQLTISQGGRLSCSQVCTLPNMYFNSRPHEEVDASSFQY